MPSGAFVAAQYMGRPVIIQADEFILISDDFLERADKRFVEVAEGFVRITVPDSLPVGGYAVNAEPRPHSVTYRLTGERDRDGNWYATKHSVGAGTGTEPQDEH